MKITKHNFFQCSTGNWSRCNKPERVPDHISDTSMYWYYRIGGHDYVVRYADHWGEALNCNWLLEGQRFNRRWQCGNIAIGDLQWNQKAINFLIKRLAILDHKTRQEIFNTFNTPAK